LDVNCHPHLLRPGGQHRRRSPVHAARSAETEARQAGLCSPDSVRAPPRRTAVGLPEQIATTSPACLARRTGRNRRISLPTSFAPAGGLGSIRTTMLLWAAKLHEL